MRKMVGKFTIQADLNLTKKKVVRKSNLRQFKFKKKKKIRTMKRFFFILVK